MIKHPSVRELRDLTKIPDDSLRGQLLEDWCNRWFVEVEYAQDVVDTAVLSSEHSDLIKIKLAQSLAAEELVEECITFGTGKKKITASMVGLRRRGK